MIQKKTTPIQQIYSISVRNTVFNQNKSPLSTPSETLPNQADLSLCSPLDNKKIFLFLCKSLY
ncbi:hypothetical protein CHISP_1237 [Chitinispirillum alkaliphilum]|nr:hypothetical protein CHISP_1237 [Chitinispirillum alkaliphilum]